MRVLAYDLRPNPVVEEMGIQYTSIEDMLPQVMMAPGLWCII